MEKAGVPAPADSRSRMESTLNTSIIAPHGPLGGKWRAIMYGPDDWASHYDTQLAARGGVMMHAINLGWTLQECRAVFLDDSNPGSVLWTQGSSGREHGPHEAARRLGADYGRCAAKAAQDPAYSSGQEARQELSTVRALVRASIWPGRTGKTDRAVLLGILDRMIEIGSDRINMPERDAALLGGVHRTAARNSLRRLSEAGLIERTRDTGTREVSHLAPGPARAHLIKASSVAISTHINLKTSPGESYMGRKGNTYDPAHETWLHLGKGAGELWSLLTDDPQGVRELARTVSVSPSTVSRRQLPKLAGHELAVMQDKGWILGPRTPGEVADANGWKGNDSKTARRRKEVVLDRISYDITRGAISVAEAKIGHPGLASEIDARFGGLEMPGSQVMAAVA